MQLIPSVKPMEPVRGGGGLANAGQAGGGVASHAENGISGERAFEFGETEIAAATGIALKLLAKTRRHKLTQGLDWNLNGVRVAYSKNGLAAVLEKITGRAEASEALQTITRINGHTPAAAAAANGCLGTVRKFYLNPRLIGVVIDGCVGITTVRVKETKNFRVGMEVPLLRTASGYELARRAPRFPGRW